MKHKIRRIAAMVCGTTVIGLAIASLKIADFGNSPYAGMALALSEATGISVSVMLPAINVLVFIPEILWGRHFIHIGTVFNAVCLGAITQLFSTLYQAVLPGPFGMAVRIPFLLFGLLLMSIGVSLYQTGDMGLAPYDAASMILTKKTKIPYFWCRMATDVTCVLITVSVGGTVGVGTLCSAFFLGPLVHFFNRFSQKLVGSEEAV